MTVRWTLNDGVTTYTFRLNPKDMTSPGAVYQRSSIPAGAGTAVRIQEVLPTANEWTFSGRIYSQEQYDELLLWQSKSQPLTLTDHLGRSFWVVLTAFNPTTLRRPHTLTRWDYEIKTLIIWRIS